MKTILTLALAAVSSTAAAQTPAVNPMPDGSRDMYVGLGVGSAPRYEGARERKTRALPVIQVEWSNGIFLSGMGAGMHLSKNPDLEYGPLLAYKPRRSESGEGGGLIGTSGMLGQSLAPATGDASTKTRVALTGNRLSGMEPVKGRLQAGGFFNVYLSPSLRVANTVLAGAGRDRDGAVWTVDLQQLSGSITTHHSLALSGGLTFANRSYNQSYYGVSLQEAFRGGNALYAPGGGLNDVHAGVRWNWTLSPSWILTSNARVTRLQGDARKSPLVERATTFSVSTGLAYRF